jgi:hypothetical protein
VGGAVRLNTAALVAALAFVPSEVSARIWHVAPDGSGDAPTIQAAVDSARSGDEVRLAAGVYTRTNQNTQPNQTRSMVEIRKRILFRGTGPDRVTLDAEGNGQVLWCDSCTIAGVTVTGGATQTGWSGGGVKLNFGAQIEGSVIRGNLTGWAGGGVAAERSSVIQDCLIEDNRVSPHGLSGGGVFLWDQSILRRSVVRGNVAGGLEGSGYGGGVACIDAIIEDCRIEDNGAGRGGGVSVEGDASIRRCLFINNRASPYRGRGWGGGIAATGSVQIEDCIFVRNRIQWFSGSDEGGAIGASAGVAVSRCTFFENSSGVANGSVTNSLFVRSIPGAACSGTINVRCCTFWDNTQGNGFCGSEPELNLAADPQFCAVDPATSLNFGLQSDSPCAPNSPCGQIGAAGVLCGSVATVPMLWGSVKQLYRGTLAP